MWGNRPLSDPVGIRVLLVEDSATDAVLIKRALRDSNSIATNIVHRSTLQGAIACASSAYFDVALLDIGLPDSQGVDTVREFDKNVSGLAVVVLTAQDDLDTALQSLTSGAQDYISKNELHSSLLGRVIRYAMERIRLYKDIEKSRDRLRLLTARLRDVKELETVRLSRDLHDVLGQKLTVLKMDLRMAEKHVESPLLANDKSVVRDRLGTACDAVDDIIMVVQEMAFDLRPSALDHLGLDGAIVEESRRFEGRTGIRVLVHMTQRVQPANQDMAVSVFRIFQELLTNVARHANASRIDVELREDAGCLVLEVQDDGLGLDLDEVEATTSLGILGMQERAAAHDGRVLFDAPSECGTRVSISVPLIKH